MCDRHSKFSRQHFVGIQTSEATLSLQRTPNRRFSSAHNADEHDRFGRVHGTICRRSDDLKRSTCFAGRPGQTPNLAFRRNALQSADMPQPKSLVAVVMGSKSDWDTMRHAVEMLDELGVPNESHVLSAHRSPDATADFARKAAGRGLRVIIAGAGAAAHLAGAIAGHTWLPVLGVPIPSSELKGLDSLLSTAQMPGGIPVGTLAIGTAGAKNAALLAAAILATSDEKMRQKLEAFRKRQSDAVVAAKLPK